MVAVLGLSMLIALSPAGALAQKEKVVDITLEPATVTTKKADTFTLTIEARLGGQKVSGIEIHLDFDPTYLEVVDADLSASGVQIESGTTTTLPFLLANTVDNTSGEITYAAGKLTEPYPTADLTVATITFRAKSSGSTSITFYTDLPRRTDARFEEGSVLRSVVGAGVGIDVAPTPVPAAPPPATITPIPPATVTPPPPATVTPPPPATVTPPPPATVTPIPPATVTPPPPAEESEVTPTPPVAPVTPVPTAPAPAAPSAPAETSEPAAPTGVAWWIWLIVGVVLVGVGGYVIARRVVY